MLAKDDFSEWIKNRALRSADSKNISRFIEEDLIYRHETFNRLILDGGLENKDLIYNLTTKYGIKKIITSAYHF